MLKDVSVILPAAGEGSRMKMVGEKQFVTVMGKPLICYTIENFERLVWVSVILVVVSNDWESLMQEIVERSGWGKVKVVSEGSFSRHRTIFNAVQILPKILQREPGVVVVHDAVRPVINQRDLQEVVMAAGMCGAAGLVRKATSTILEGNETGEVMVRALERGRLWESHTPQAFQYALLKEAYERCPEWDLNHGTECLDLVHKYASLGDSASSVSSPSSQPSLSSSDASQKTPFVRLIEITTHFNKITYKEDLKIFECYLKEQELAGKSEIN